MGSRRTRSRRWSERSSSPRLGVCVGWVAVFVSHNDYGDGRDGRVDDGLTLAEALRSKYRVFFLLQRQIVIFLYRISCIVYSSVFLPFFASRLDYRG